jgi:hypothetical protein
MERGEREKGNARPDLTPFCSPDRDQVAHAIDRFPNQPRTRRVRSGDGGSFDEHRSSGLFFRTHGIAGASQAPASLSAIPVSG